MMSNIDPQDREKTHVMSNIDPQDREKTQVYQILIHAIERRLT